MSIFRRHVFSNTFAYATIGKVAAFSSPANQQLVVYGAECGNATGGAIAVGIMKRQSLAAQQFWQISTNGGTPADGTAVIQAGTASALMVASTNDTGFIIQAAQQFSMIGLQISTLQGSGYTLAYQYWNGTSWAALTLLATGVFTGTGDKYLFFLPPLDWVPGDTTVNTGKYSVRVLATTAGSGAAPLATGIWTAQCLKYNPAVASNASIDLEMFSDYPLILDSGESLQGYYSTANAANWISARTSIFE